MKLTDEIVKALNGCITDGYESVQEFARLTNISADTLAKYLKKSTDIILDPGFGFSKSLEQNYELLSGVHRLKELGCPVLVGVSRKSMIYRALGVTPAEALNGTTALHWEALRQGASILRVHDVREACEVVKLFKQYEKGALQ